MQSGKVNIMWLCGPLGRGGTVTHISNWARHIDKSKYKVTLVYFSPLKEKIFDAIKGVKFIHVPELMGIQKYYGPSILKLSKLLKAYRISILHTILPQSDILGAIAAKVASTPIVVSSLEGRVDQTPMLKKAIYKTMYRLVTNRFDKIIAISVATKSEFCEYTHVPPHKVQVIHSGIDLQKFLLSSHQQNFPLLQKMGDAPVVATLSVLHPVKRLEYFVEAIPLILDCLPQTQFVIAGDGTERLRLEDMVLRLGLSSKVHFLGWISNTASLLKAIDVLVLCSLTEGIPWTILEALSLAKPVIATRVGGIPEVIEHGVTGWLVEPRDSRAIADAVISILLDSKKAKAIGQAGYKKIKSHFTVEQEVKNLESLYYMLLGNRGHI